MTILPTIQMPLLNHKFILVERCEEDYDKIVIHFYHKWSHIKTLEQLSGIVSEQLVHYAQQEGIEIIRSDVHYITSLSNLTVQINK